MGKKLSVSFLLIFLFIFLPSVVCEAANSAHMSDGNIIFVTTDTKAVTSVRWMTAGFTIRKDASYGNPLKDGNYAAIALLPADQSVHNNGNGTYRITYMIPKKKVDRALIAAGLDGIKDGDTIYFNTIFRLKIYGVVQSKSYYSLSGIKHAAGWRNPNDFDEHFDIAIKFDSANYHADVEYISVNNEVLKKKRLGDWKAGKKVTVQLEGERAFGGAAYLLCKSYYVDLSNPSRRKNIIKAAKEDYGKPQTQSGKLKIGGMKITAIMKKKPKGPPDEGEPEGDPDIPIGRLPEPAESIEKTLDIEEAEARAEIRSKKYNVETAIPSGEPVFIKGNSSDSLLEYKFTRYEGSTVYAVNIQAAYLLSWKEKVGKQWKQKTRTVDGSRTVYVERPYSYWTVDYFNYYTAGTMEIENDALPGKKAVLGHMGYNPQYKYQKTEHNYELVKTITVNKGTISQNVSNALQMPSYLDYDAIADKAAEKLETANDILIFNGETIFDNAVCLEETEAPVLPNYFSGRAEYFRSGIKIPAQIDNEWYNSKGKIEYVRKIAAVEGASSEDACGAAEKLICAVEEINQIVVHTPIVCSGRITDQSAKCQSVKPNPARCQLVLDTDFCISVSYYGEHQPYKGYGLQDYARFCSSTQICFPFDVYRDGVYYPAGSWQGISEGAYHLPIWVEEGEYAVQFRAAARNAAAGSAGMSGANLDMEYYVALSEVPVEVSGRIYGLKLYDISDYPLWQPIFRKENSSEPSGMAYYVGTKNQNGVETGLDPLYTLPVLAGSHPLYQRAGGTKTGYKIRASLKTVGSFYHEEDSIEMVPTFYFVDKNGENREQVEVYYDESVFGKYRKLIRVGSERDKQNRRTVGTLDSGLAINIQEIFDTVSIRGIKYEDMAGQAAEWNGYGSFQIPSALRTFTGIAHLFGGGYSILDDIGSVEVQRAKQNWYFEYMLPSSCHIAPYGFDVEEYAERHPIDFQETFWKTDGYLIVQFHIYACRDKERKLDYLNEANAVNGYCNMWKTEGYYYEKIDENGVHFHLQNGDFLIFSQVESVSGSAGEDYAAGGTH